MNQENRNIDADLRMIEANQASPPYGVLERHWVIYGLRAIVKTVRNEPVGIDVDAVSNMEVAVKPSLQITPEGVVPLVYIVEEGEATWNAKIALKKVLIVIELCVWFGPIRIDGLIVGDLRSDVRDFRCG